MLVLNTLQFKKCLCVLTLPKRNGPDLYNFQTRKKYQMIQTTQIELSINSNTTRSKI